MGKKKNIDELLRDKMWLIENRFGQKPFEAIGVDETTYLRWKPTTRYSRLCEVIRCNGLIEEKPKEGLKHDVDNFRKFLRIATVGERESLLELIGEVLKKEDARKKIKDEIELKKKELKALESKLIQL